MNNIYTPAPRQPHFACSQCIRRFFNRAGLKNHIRAKHSTIRTSTGQSLSPPSNGPAPQQPSNIPSSLPPSPSTEINDFASIRSLSSIDTENGHQTPDSMDEDFIPPFPDLDNFNDYDDYDERDDYGYGDGLETNTLEHNSSRSSTPLCISSATSRRPKKCTHQQKPADNRYLKRRYHHKLNGKFVSIS